MKRTIGGVLGGLLGLVGLSAVAGILVAATVTPAIAVTAAGTSSAISLFDSLPSDLEVDRPMESSTIWGNNGNGQDGYYKLATFYDQNREPVEYDDVTQTVYDALLSSEDPRYYEHGGVDLIGTTRALLNNASGGSQQGGSSISQQYVKNVQIQACERSATGDTQEEQDAARIKCYNEATDANGVDGYQRKLQEMRYAIAIEQRYSKEEILIGYLNLANFGGTTYGIQAAAQHYYGVNASDLNLNQAATLAGMLQNPNTFRIDLPDNADNGAENGYAETQQRRDSVLRRMYEEDILTKQEYEDTMAQPIEPNVQDLNTGCAEAGGAAYFCQYVKNTVLYDDRYADAFGDTAEERSDTLTRGGLDIYTTLDNDLQWSAQNTMANHVPASIEGMSLGATTVQIDTHTGNILSMAQNTTFNEVQESAGQTGLIYATDRTMGGGAGFSAGSTYKLFTLVDWLLNGRSVNEQLNGRANQTFNIPTSCTDDSKTSLRTTTKDNFAGNGGYVGPVRNFTRDSLNTGFYAMASQLNVCDINQVAADFGVVLGAADENGSTAVTDQNFANNVIGDKNIAPIAMASAYATIANGGVRCEPTAIVRVTSGDGDELTMPETQCERVVDENIAATAEYALETVLQSGGSGSQGNAGDGVPVFGKTGTHEGVQTWLIQSSSNVTTAAWAGNSIGDGDVFANYTPNGEQVATLRYALGRENQAAANAKYGGDAFPDPDPNLTRTVEKDVPNVVGQTQSAAQSTLEAAGFTVSIGDTVTGTQDAGRVEAQSASGTAPANSTITLTISDGNGVEVPDIGGQTLARGISALFDAGLRGSPGSCTQNDDAKGSSITGTSPAAGEAIADGGTVTVDYEAKNCDDVDTGDGGDDD